MARVHAQRIEQRLALQFYRAADLRGGDAADHERAAGDYRETQPGCYGSFFLWTCSHHSPRGLSQVRTRRISRSGALLDLGTLTRRFRGCQSMHAKLATVEPLDTRLWLQY